MAGSSSQPRVRETSAQDTTERLRALLVATLRRRETLIYREAARALMLPPPHTIHQVTELLERLMHEDAGAGAPFVSCCVVSRARAGLPAPGFFATAAATGRYAGAWEGPEAEAYHAAELGRAIAYWGG